MPNSFSIIAIASFSEKCGKSSCRDLRLLAISYGTTSGLVDSNCPNFIKIGPRSSKASLSLSPDGSFAE